jgi:hypothetical protein
MSYHHLTMDERNVIYRMQFQGHSQVEIARCLGRHRSSIGRELRRNPNVEGRYDPPKKAEAVLHPCWPTSICTTCSTCGPGTRSILREPRASLESTRGGSGRTLEKDGPHAGENRPGTGESRRRQRPTACL